LRENTTWALICKGMLLGQKGDVEEALDALSEAIRRFGPTSATPAENAGRALIERAGHLCDLGRNTEALTDCDDFLVSYDVQGETQVSEFVAQALLIKGLSLANLDKIADAVETLEKTVARFSGEAAEPIASFIKQAGEVLRELRGLEDEACRPSEVRPVK
jgi:tetratricopeptide (TPR) repeat protein